MLAWLQACCWQVCLPGSPPACAARTACLPQTPVCVMRVLRVLVYVVCILCVCVRAYARVCECVRICTELLVYTSAITTAWAARTLPHSWPMLSEAGMGPSQSTAQASTCANTCTPLHRHAQLRLSQRVHRVLLAQPWQPSSPVTASEAMKAIPQEDPGILQAALADFVWSKTTEGPTPGSPEPCSRSPCSHSPLAKRWKACP